MPEAGNFKEDLSYWQKRWENGDAPWHSDKPLVYFEMFLDQLVRDQREGDEERTLTFFLPLCGKAGDIPWLLEKGHNVVGVEGVESVVKALFEENKIEYGAEAMPGGVGTKFKSADGRLLVFACDFFDFGRSALDAEGVALDIVLDRGSLVAVPDEDRKRYADLMATLTAQPEHPFRCLLCSYEYDQTKYQGHPRAVWEREVRELYEKRHRVEELRRFDESEKGKKRFGVDKLERIIYLITPKKE